MGKSPQSAQLTEERERERARERRERESTRHPHHRPTPTTSSRPARRGGRILDHGAGDSNYTIKASGRVAGPARRTLRPRAGEHNQLTCAFLEARTRRNRDGNED